MDNQYGSMWINFGLHCERKPMRFAGSYHVNSDDSLTALEGKQRGKDEKQQKISDRKAAREFNPIKWNKLPNHITCQTSLKSFSKMYKNHLISTLN